MNPISFFVAGVVLIAVTITQAQLLFSQTPTCGPCDQAITCTSKQFPLQAIFTASNGDCCCVPYSEADTSTTTPSSPSTATATVATSSSCDKVTMSLKPFSFSEGEMNAVWHGSSVESVVNERCSKECGALPRFNLVTPFYSINKDQVSGVCTGCCYSFAA